MAPRHAIPAHWPNSGAQSVSEVQGRQPSVGVWTQTMLSQVSCVQAFWSLQSRSVWQQLGWTWRTHPSAGSQKTTAQRFGSGGQSSGSPPVQLPPAHTAPTVQASAPQLSPSWAGGGLQCGGGG